MPGTLGELPVTSRRKVGMTSSHHGPYGLGYTRATMAVTVGSDGANPELISKSRLSSDCSLQLESMKSESLVIAYQHDAVNTFPGPCTHRPSHHGSWLYPKTVR